MATNTTTQQVTHRPTMEELRQFARLPWVRCPTCRKVTGNLQEKFDEILADKTNVYYDNLEPIYQTLIDQGFDELTAQKLADRQARIIADVTFNKRITNELGLTRYCCFNTLENPIQLPLGSGIELDPEVDVGERLSRLQIKQDVNPVLPGAKGEVVVPPTKRVYIARPEMTLPGEETTIRTPQTRRVFRAV